MKNFKHSYQDILFSKMRTDYTYQRPLDKKRTKKIVDEFNDSRVNPVKVAHREDGFYYIWDGQHTAYACAIHSNIEKGGKYEPDYDTYIKCIVYEGMTPEDEALLFAEQDNGSRSITNDQKFKARYIAGDKDVIRFRETVESLGIVCDFKNNGGSKPMTISCYATCFSIFNKNISRLCEILSLIKEVWNDDKDAFRKEIISGLNIFLNSYENRYNRNILVSKLKSVTPTYIIRNAKDSFQRGDVRYALQIVSTYNKSMRRGQLDYNVCLNKNYK